MMNTNSGWHIVPQIFTACFVPGAIPNATGKAKAETTRYLLTMGIPVKWLGARGVSKE